MIRHLWSMILFFAGLVNHSLTIGMKCIIHLEFIDVLIFSHSSLLFNAACIADGI